MILDTGGFKSPSIVLAFSEAILLELCSLFVLDLKEVQSTGTVSMAH